MISEKREISLTIRNVDITHFPEVSVIVEAFNRLGQPLDTLTVSDVHIVENGKEKKIVSVKKISTRERVPVDFVFAIDVTGSMQYFIDGVRSNITRFTSSLVRRGIDYRIGLVLFSDDLEGVYPLTSDVFQFQQWLEKVSATGGNDEKENALEALSAVARMEYRPPANRVCVIVTDAPYHQKGEMGNGITKHTTESMKTLLVDKGIRLFSIVPERMTQYAELSAKTRGNTFDIYAPFSQILDNFSNQLTNLYALTYRTDEAAIPDSIEIGILDYKKTELVKKIIPVVEIGRKLIIENLLFESNSSGLPQKVSELDVITEFMTNKPTVRIQIEGHTDSKGPAPLNMRLSVQRANAVKEYLVSRGIKGDRIAVLGYGESKPIVTNDTEFGRRLNRRTEIVIISK